MLRPSSRKGLSYRDAVRMLGSGESPVIELLGRLAGVGAITGVAFGAGDLFALRDEVVRWGNGAVRGLRERLTGLGRFDRTQRLVAAHTIIVVGAFFEAFDEALTAISVDPDTLEITTAEQVAMSTDTAAERSRSTLLQVLAGDRVPLPSPTIPHEVLTHELRSYYAGLTASVLTFLNNLSTYENTPTLVKVFRSGKRFRTAIEAAAVRRYEIAYRSLAAEVPEFAIWAAMTDAAAGRATTERIGAELGERLTDLTTGLAGVRALLDDLTTGNADAHRWDLVSRYRLRLSRPILDVDALPDGVALPSLERLYLNPRARVRRADGRSPVATEDWWSDAVLVADIQPFLAGYLTGPEATATPLVVLGQPGSGKSLLSQVLAANLPPGSFLPVRVELRSVPADASLQEQIETAIYQTIGERVNWPELVRGAGGALPVVMLDGFDELLQAAGVNRASYLEEVRDFQRREAELGRPLVVLLTTRTVVADRARVPEGSTMLRLEPFDDLQIGRWLDVWAIANTAGLAQRRLTSLPVAAALRYRELAEQPLLLLMLALYDAWDNALQRAKGGLDSADLYERLFTDFAQREIGRREPDLPSDQRPAAVEREIRQLAIVALAMFNRGTQVITDEQLDADLAALLGDARTAHDSHRLLTAAQLMVGRFFFIHESRARPGVDGPVKSFEFLHATFGEFLVARLVVETLVELAEERAHQARRRNPGALDAGFLYATLSFTVLTGSAPIVEFCRAGLAGLTDGVREECRKLLLELLRDAGHPHPTWSLSDYQPVQLTLPARHAAFTANLVVLILPASGGGIPWSDLFPSMWSDHWRSHALLWESQLPEDAWRSLWQSIRVTQVYENSPVEDSTLIWTEGRLDLEDGSAVTLSSTLIWDSVLLGRRGMDPDRPFVDISLPADSSVGTWLRKAAFRGDRGTVTALAHSLSPYWHYVAPAHLSIVGDPSGTNTQALLELLLAPRGADAATTRHLRSAYLTCVVWFDDHDRIRTLILQCLENDAEHIDPEVVIDVLIKAQHWSDHLPDVAQVLAVLFRRTRDPGLVRDFCFLAETQRSLDNLPTEPSLFRSVEWALTRLGLDVPAELTERP